MRRGGGESSQGASVGAPRAGHKRPIVVAGGGHRLGCPGGRQPLGAEGSGSGGTPAAPSPAAGKAWPLRPCQPCSSRPDPCPRASARSPPWRRTSPRALAPPAPAASRAPRRGGTAPAGPPPSGAASGSPCGMGGPPGSGCGARLPSPLSPRAPGTLRGLAGPRPPQRRRCRAPGTHAPVGLRCGAGWGHPGARCGAGWGHGGVPSSPMVLRKSGGAGGEWHPEGKCVCLSSKVSELATYQRKFGAPAWCGHGTRWGLSGKGRDISLRSSQPRQEGSQVTLRAPQTQPAAPRPAPRTRVCTHTHRGTRAGHGCDSAPGAGSQQSRCQRRRGFSRLRKQS